MADNTATMAMDSVPGTPTGIDAMMAQLDAAAASGKTIEAPAAPAADGKPAEPAPAAAKPDAAAKPAEAKPAAPAPAAAKPETKPDAKPQQAEPDWTKAPPKWYKIYEEHKTKTGETIKSLESKIKSLEGKPFEQAGDAKKLEAYEKQLAELRNEANDYKTRLAQRDFTQSDEYKRNYVEPANRVYAEAVGFVQRVKVRDGDMDRAATQADFDYIRSLPLDARRRAATEMFGDNATDVLDYARDIDRIKRDATIAAERHAQDHERTSLEREGRTKQERQQYEDFRKSALDGIRSNETWGKWFSEDANDPEASKLLREGFDEIEKVTQQLDKLPLDQQAAYSALYLARAAATPRLMLEVNRLTAKYEAAIEELEKLRGTDPGAEGKQGVAAAAEGAAKPKGIEGAVAVFDQMPR